MRKTVPEFEGEKKPKTRVFTQSLLGNFRGDEREATAKKEKK